MIVAGVGFSSNCGALELADLVRRAQAAVGRPSSALATPAWKADAACLAAAAEMLALPIIGIESGRLSAVDHRLFTQSAASRAAAGVGSVAEAAALAAAGPGARLVLARISSRHATCAVSEGEPL